MAKKRLRDACENCGCKRYTPCRCLKKGEVRAPEPVAKKKRYKKKYKK